MELNIRLNNISTDILDNEPDQLGNKIRLRETSKFNLIRHVKNIPVSVSGYSVKPYYENEKMEFEGVRPINVKSSMLSNIALHGNINSNEINSVDTQNNNNIDNEIAGSTFDQIADARKAILSIQEEASKAQESARISDEELSKISVEDTEIQKRLQVAIMKQQEIKKQISEALKNQNETLNKARKQFESVIEESNRKREENQNKILQFQNKITETKKQISMIEDDIAQQEEILKALRVA